MLTLEDDLAVPGFRITSTQAIPSQPCVNPLVPDGTEYVQVHPNALLPTLVMSNVWEFPGELDPERLRKALGALTKWWPVIAGRYVQRTAPEPGLTDFAIKLVQSPITYETAEYDTANDAFDTIDVIQSSLAPYLPTLGADYAVPDTDTILFAARLTTLRPANVSVLGICLSHVLVDADGTCRLIQNLSRLYEDPECSLTETERPGFLERPRWPTWPPSEEVYQRGVLRDLAEIPAEEANELYARHEVEKEDVLVRLSKEELTSIKEKYGVEGGTGHDALCGWLLDLMERAGETKDTQITLTFNYRRCFQDDTILPPLLVNQVDSVAIIVVIPKEPTVSSTERPQQLARTLRNGISRFRTDKQWAIDNLTPNIRQLETVNADAANFYLFPRENKVNINSNMRYDWQPKFGFEGISSHYTTFTGRRYIRVFRTNPTRGVVQTEWSGGVDLKFGIQKGTKGRFDELLQADRAGW